MAAPIETSMRPKPSLESGWAAKRRNNYLAYGSLLQANRLDSSEGFLLHYYKRHLGDYAAKAGHLSPLEHGVYNLILDAYYGKELAPTKAEAIRHARARTDSELAAVDAVLSEFFAERDGRFYQSRVEDELSAYRKKAETNSRIAKDRESTKKARSVHESFTTESPIVHETCKSGEPNHKPPTINHKPLEKRVIQPPVSNSGAVGGFPAVGDWVAYLDQKHQAGIGIRGRMDRQTGATLKKWIDARISASTVDECILEAKETAGGPILNLVTYVDAMLSRKQAASLKPSKEEIIESKNRAAMEAWARGET